MKLQISLSNRTPQGIKQDAYEWALHQVNFDRDNRFSEIKKIVLSGKLFSKIEVASDSFQQGVEKAETDAKRENKNLRGTIIWNL